MSNPLDNLNIDTNDVDVSRPYLPKGTYELEIATAKVEESKKTPGNYNLVVSFITTQDEEAVNGSTISPGFPITKYYPIQQSDNPKAPDFRVDLTKLVVAAFNERLPINAETIDNLPSRRVLASLRIREDDTYGPSNEISNLKPVE